MKIKQELEVLRGSVVFTVTIGDEESDTTSKSFTNLNELVSLLTHGGQDIERQYDNATVKLHRILFSGQSETGSDLHMNIDSNGMNGHMKPVVLTEEVELELLNEFDKIQVILDGVKKSQKGKWS